jgi:hypothetical protein
VLKTKKKKKNKNKKKQKQKTMKERKRQSCKGYSMRLGVLQQCVSYEFEIH